MSLPPASCPCGGSVHFLPGMENDGSGFFACNLCGRVFKPQERVPDAYEVEAAKLENKAKRVYKQQISSRKYMWTTMKRYGVTVVVGHSEELLQRIEDSNGEHFYPPDAPPVYLRFEDRIEKKSFDIKFGSMTDEEARAMEEVIVEAFRVGRMTCKRLDDIAREDLENGNDVNSRLYRPIPQVFDRKRSFPQYGEGLPFGLDGLGELGRSPKNGDSGDQGDGVESV